MHDIVCQTRYTGNLLLTDPASESLLRRDWDLQRYSAVPWYKSGGKSVATFLPQILHQGAGGVREHEA